QAIPAIDRAIVVCDGPHVGDDRVTFPAADRHEPCVASAPERLLHGLVGDAESLADLYVRQARGAQLGNLATALRIGRSAAWHGARRFLNLRCLDGFAASACSQGAL